MLRLIETAYKTFFKPIAFSLNPEFVHETMTGFGELIGSSKTARHLIARTCHHSYHSLNQYVAGIHFKLPVGLSAGFDYNAQLTQILPDIGFGFQSIGTITYGAYEGNTKPRLGRLPKSKSLMVNKGFKNKGARAIAEKLSGLDFRIPVGISIGRTNKEQSVESAIDDIVRAFIVFERAPVKHSYYELNISCPNLKGDVSFYHSHTLNDLLNDIDALHLKKPVFVKMPIEKSDHETLRILEVISRHTPVGVIFGNLQKDRKDPALLPEEVAKFGRGNFSGKPTEKRSNELISLAYNHFGDRLIIIGCGGIFSAEDAYEKIKRGASLVQLITGMIFQGPQLIAQINKGVAELMKRDGFNHISEVTGSYYRV